MIDTIMSKKSITIGMVAALVLLLMSSCSGNKSEVAPGSSSLPTPPAPIAAEPSSVVAVPSLGNQVGNLAPDFRLNDLEGKTVSLSEFRGKPVLLNFWATW